MNDRTPTVVVADASWMECQMLATTIHRHNHFRVISSVTTRKEVIAAISKLGPEIAVISSRLQDGALAGLLVLREIRSFQPRPRTIVLLDDDQSELVVEAFRNGASGIFCRTGATTEFHKCLQCVYEGQIWANNTQVEHIVTTLMSSPVTRSIKTTPITTLSEREEEVARLVASGLTNGEVAERLSLSRHTVKNYLFSVFQKLGISTRVELVLYILSQAGRESEQNEVAAETKFKMPA